MLGLRIDTPNFVYTVYNALSVLSPALLIPLLALLVLHLKRPYSLFRTETAILNSKFGGYIIYIIVYYLFKIREI